jgi:uncharacterized protein
MDSAPEQDNFIASNDLMAQPPVEDRPGSAVFFGPYGLRAGWSLLIFLFIVFLLGLSVSGVYTHLHPHHTVTVTANSQQKPAAAPPAEEAVPSQVLFSHGIPLAVIVFASWLMTFIERRRFGVYGFGGVQRVSDYAKGLLTGVVMLSLLVGTLRLSHLLVFDGMALSGSIAVLYGLKWLAGFALVGVAEEYMFRGYLQYTIGRGLSGILPRGNAYRNMLGFWLAAILLSSLFLLGHTGNPGESPIGLLCVFLVGMVFAYSLWRTGSLWWAIGVHTAWDWAQSYLYGVRDSGLISKGCLFHTHPTGNILLSGGLTGPEGSLFILGVLVIFIVLIRTTLPKRERPTLFPLSFPAGLQKPDWNQVTPTA